MFRTRIRWIPTHDQIRWELVMSLCPFLYKGPSLGTSTFHPTLERHLHSGVLGDKANYIPRNMSQIIPDNIRSLARRSWFSLLSPEGPCQHSHGAFIYRANWSSALQRWLLMRMHCESFLQNNNAQATFHGFWFHQPGVWPWPIFFKNFPKWLVLLWSQRQEPVD